MADALDSKSSVRKGVWVRLPPSVLETRKALTTLVVGAFFCAGGAVLSGMFPSVDFSQASRITSPKGGSLFDDL